MDANTFVETPSMGKRYQLDDAKPKSWQFFQTVYEETNQRSEEPRSVAAVTAVATAAAAAAVRDRRQQLSVFQQLFMEFFLKIVDPE